MMWNELVKVINKHNIEAVRSQAKLLLGQLNTAGGAMIKAEIQQFLDAHSNQCNS